MAAQAQDIQRISPQALHARMADGEAVVPIDVRTTQEVVKAGAGQSRVADNWLAQRNFKDTYTSDPDALVQLMHKDLRLALELGHDVGVSLPGAALAQQLIERFLGIKE